MPWCSGFGFQLDTSCRKNVVTHCAPCLNLVTENPEGMWPNMGNTFWKEISTMLQKSFSHNLHHQEEYTLPINKKVKTALQQTRNAGSRTVNWSILLVISVTRTYPIKSWSWGLMRLWDVPRIDQLNWCETYLLLHKCMSQNTVVLTNSCWRRFWTTIIT